MTSPASAWNCGDDETTGQRDNRGDDTVDNPLHCDDNETSGAARRRPQRDQPNDSSATTTTAAAADSAAMALLGRARFLLCATTTTTTTTTATATATAAAAVATMAWRRRGWRVEIADLLRVLGHERAFALVEGLLDENREHDADRREEELRQHLTYHREGYEARDICRPGVIEREKQRKRRSTCVERAAAAFDRSGPRSSSRRPPQ